MNRTLEIGLFGIAGGIAGLAAKRIAGEIARRVLPRGGKAPSPGRSWSLVGTQYEGKDEPSTEALSRVIYTKLAGRPPTAALKKRLGTAVHWGFGATTAVAYALARRQRCGLDLGGGLVFGLLVWGIIDEVGLSLLGLQGAPTAYPPSSHVNALAQHLAYGAAVAATTQGLAHAL
jgi:hypothetical protein